MNARLAISDLCMSFGALAVTRNVSLSLESGARTALIGPNGAGKTTLINLICGIHAPTSGEITLDGEPVTRLSQPARVRRGIVRTFQVNRLFKELTVAENVRVSVLQRLRAGSRLFLDRGSRDQVTAEVAAELAALGLTRLQDRMAGRLALGEQRLVEIALALAQKPRVLLLDEPLAGVPKGEGNAILDAVAQLPSDLAVLLIEHDMDVVFRFARRIIVLVAGSVLVEGAPADVATDERVKQTYFGRAHDVRH